MDPAQGLYIVSEECREVQCLKSILPGVYMLPRSYTRLGHKGSTSRLCSVPLSGGIAAAKVKTQSKKSRPNLQL